jgi:hypothetical protein
MSLKQTARIKIISDVYRGIDEFKKGYQPRTNIVEDENGDLLADSRRKNYPCQLLNVHGVNDVRQTNAYS